MKIIEVDRSQGLKIGSRESNKCLRRQLSLLLKRPVLNDNHSLLKISTVQSNLQWHGVMLRG